MKIQDPLEAIRLELEDVAFKKAKAAGLATVRGQVCLNIKIKQQVCSTQITPAEWERLIGLDIGPKGRKMIKALRDSNNQPVKLFSYFKEWEEVDTFLNHVRSYSAPLYISTSDSSVACVKKRMVRTRG